MFDTYRSANATVKSVVPGMVRRPIDLMTNQACRIFEIEVSESFNRFPKEGCVVNNKSDLVIRTLEGIFSLVPKNNYAPHVWGDGYIFIPKGEPFFIRKNLMGQKPAKFLVTAIPFCEKKDFEFIS